jgi:hypothetical protein
MRGRFGAFVGVIGIGIAALVAIMLLTNRPAQTASNQTPPPALATADLGDPFDTFPPDAVDTAEPGPSGTQGSPPGIACRVNPPYVPLGATFELSVVETPGWYGEDRYYVITGIPDGAFEGGDSMGGIKDRLIYAATMPSDPAFSGTVWQPLVRMRDWTFTDTVHVGTDPGRDASTLHEGTCQTSFTVPVIP